ncbi:MAG: hypothetical protein DIZ80_02105 [endosymbiont of Galathealinum brachiosum]|uniref:Tandem-95 repeat protein n=1 Tax=endosymbiont of Galathealinum brachiosum TaxID=2200906 RepID=A0A370DLF6_9GAMM|nr:MAG: hypothetical protein DIZ80_02105 [endosymbiont of Galathealinum brachiosum]
MNKKTFKIKPISLALLLAGLGVAPASYAVDLMAVEGTWTPAGGAPITMWGFSADTGTCPAAPVSWNTGPQLTDADLVAGNLTINLRNCLSESVSIVIPGQPASFTPVRNASGRVTAFTTEAAANGGIATYNWAGVKSGTYLYQSGSHPAKQVQMGLYGALTVGDYAGTSGDVTLLYSEIDPALHNPPAAATPLGYNPRHYLVNGSDTQSVISAGDTNQPTILRFLNAGLDFHVPALNGGYMTLIAEDGNAYPFVKQQYSVNLAAGKTIDSMWQAATAGDHVIYDRRGNGMATSLNVTAGVGAPVATADVYSTDEDTAFVVAAPGVLGNDGSGLSAILVSAPSSGALSSGLASDGSFTYTPNANFNGQDSFTYKVNDGSLDSNVVSASITVNAVNDAPVAVDNVYDVIEGAVLNVTEINGVCSNDTDVDGDAVSAILDTSLLQGTLTSLNSNGSFDYDPGLTPAGSSVSFTYYANDGTENSAIPATVTLNIISQPNSAPVALEDSTTVQRNSPASFINLTNNDTDADGNLKDSLGNVAAAQITVTTGSISTRGGSVTVVTNGVNYSPKRNFRGTDTFNYTVTDADGAVSNEVTVRVNVVR